MKDKLLKKTLKLLTALEWSAIDTQCRSADSFVIVATCPYCAGIDPEDEFAHSFKEVGHEKKCKLQELTKQIIKELSK